MADSLYNLQLVQDFCASRLPRGCPLSLEDLLYVPPPLKVRLPRGPHGHPGLWIRATDSASCLQINLMVLLAELFMCFEVLKPDFVQVKDLPDGHGKEGLAPDLGWDGVEGDGGDKTKPCLTLCSACSRLPPGHRGLYSPEQQWQQVHPLVGGDFPATMGSSSCWVPPPAGLARGEVLGGTLVSTPKKGRGGGGGTLS